MAGRTSAATVRQANWGWRPIAWMDGRVSWGTAEFPVIAVNKAVSRNSALFPGAGFAPQLPAFERAALKAWIIRLVDAQDAVAELALGRYESCGGESIISRKVEYSGSGCHLVTGEAV